MRCVGLDLGTTKISAVLIDTDPPPGRVLGVVSRGHGAGLPAARPFEHLQDPERILVAAREALRALAGPGGPAGPKAPGWDGVCVTGQMHGVLYADAAGRAVSPLMSWLDNRAGQPHPAGGTWAQRLSAAAGRPIAAGYGAATHFYNRHHGLVPPRAAYLCTVMDWATWKLTGGSAGSASAAGPASPGGPVTDATIAASVGLADPLTGQPDPRALREAALEGLLPPQVVEAGTRVGSTAGEGGLPSGVPVFAPLGDNQAGFLGAVRDVEAMALLNVGTGGQVSAWLPALPEEAGGAGRPGSGLEARPFPGGGVLLVGATLCAGRAYALLEEFFREVLEAFGGRAEAELYERMNALAGGREAGAAGGEGPLVDTRFNGTREDPRITGSIAGITLRNLTPAALVRAFLAGIAGELHGRYAELVGLRAAAPGGLVGSGNGLRRNPALRAEISRRCGLPLRLPRLREEAALGAALAAAVGLGRYPGFRAAGQIIRYEDEEDSGG